MGGTQAVVFFSWILQVQESLACIEGFFVCASQSLFNPGRFGIPLLSVLNGISGFVSFKRNSSGMDQLLLVTAWSLLQNWITQKPQLLIQLQYLFGRWVKVNHAHWVHAFDRSVIYALIFKAESLLEFLIISLGLK